MRQSRFPGRRPFAAALRVAAFCLTLAAFSASLPFTALAEERIALVIGNSDYRNVGKLPNPANDAADMAESLKRLGFSVKHLTDVDYDGFRHALITFGHAAKTADKAIIFYAGHGVEIDGKNWLIPVDAEIRSAIDVYAEAINLETLIDISVFPKVLGLVILDACRNDPFAAPGTQAGRSVARTANAGADSAAGASRKKHARASAAQAVQAGTAARGLAPVDVNDNVLVAFAAAAGTTASDGIDRNSPYSGALLRYIEKPGLEINYVFRNVHDDVLTETKTQSPTVYGTLSRDEIYLGGDASVATGETDADAEKVAWAFVRATSDIATLRRFAAQFPASSHLSEVHGRVEELEKAERFAWAIVEKEKSVPAYRAFLDLYPSGERAEGARATLASLEATPGATKRASPTPSLPKPPASSYQLASASADVTTTNSDSIDKAWDVLKESHDKKLVGTFAQKYPSLRQHRIPAGSDLALRTVDPTDWMLRTAQDADVNSCFSGNSASCATAAKRYPEYVQLQFQLCRTSGQPAGCMQKAVAEARRKGYLVSAYTRSDIEKRRNHEYRRTIERVNQRVGTIVGNTVSNAVGNAVNNAVNNSVNNAVSMATSRAAGQAASRAASSAASRAASSAASRAASGAASKAASSAAANAAARAAANAASNIRIPSDARLKTDIVPLVRTRGGFQLYRYRYIGDDTSYVGVMAQDIARQVPAAVSIAEDGYWQVDYGLLGIEFLAYRDWVKSHGVPAAN
ncbi:MAG: caspase family protein [Xanthobacteraceae bacterium]